MIKLGLNPVGLPKSQFASSGAYFKGGSAHQALLQLEQPVAAHPLHADEEAEEDTVSPLAVLLTNPQADICLATLLLLHEGQPGFSDRKTRYSKS